MTDLRKLYGLCTLPTIGSVGGAKAFVTVVLCFMFETSSFGQPIYFDQFFDFNGLTESLKNSVVHPEGYLFNMRPTNVFADTSVLNLILIDEQGNELRRTEFNPGGRVMNFGTLVTHSDYGHAFFNSVGDTIDNTRDFHLVRYDGNGEVVFTKEYAKEGDDICFWGIQCNDGGFALCGQAGNSDGSSADIMLIRTDSDGNELWRKFYGGSGFEGGADPVETDDGGFLMLGWTRSFGAGQGDFYLVKADEQGNQEWYKRYGGNGNELGQDILVLEDGNYLLIGGGSDDGVNSHGKIIKIRPNGTEIWNRDYTIQNGDNLFGALELPDGSIVATGLTTTVGESNAGWLIKTDLDGNLLWQRKYNRSAQPDYFYSVLSTTDGGFLLSGQAINQDNLTQDAWLLKVDSVGCPYPNCTVGIDEEAKSILVDVWPNPAKDVLNIEKQDLSTELELSVFDVSGKLILRFTQNDRQQQIDVSGWPSGVYVLKGTDDKGRSFSTKLVKQ